MEAAGEMLSRQSFALIGPPEGGTKPDHRLDRRSRAGNISPGCG